MPEPTPILFLIVFGVATIAYFIGHCAGRKSGYLEALNDLKRDDQGRMFTDYFKQYFKEGDDHER